MAKHNETGSIGETIARNWLISKGFAVLECNYRKKYGEIDIVARETDEKVHFVEVKTVSYETRSDLERSVSYGTWRPEENVHKHKQLRLSRTIQVWLAENKYNGSWQFDIVTVRVVLREKYARIMHMKNIVF